MIKAKHRMHMVSCRKKIDYIVQVWVFLNDIAYEKKNILCFSRKKDFQLTHP